MDKKGFIPKRDDGDNERQQISQAKVRSAIKPQMKLSVNRGRKCNTLLANQNSRFTVNQREMQRIN